MHLCRTWSIDAAQSKNRQAGASVVADQDMCAVWVESLTRFYEIAEKQYKDALAEGVPKELARIVMPVGHYSRMRAATNLRNWLAFMTLRADSAAQFEIREYAKALGQILSVTFPRTWALYEEAHKS